MLPSAPKRSSLATRYRIVPLDPHAHLYEVSVTVEDPDASGQRFQLPTWIPGSYLIREFARHFVTRAGGVRRPVSVPITKTAKNVWQAATCTRSADGGCPSLCVRSIGARRLPRRHARLLQRTFGVPASGRPRARTVHRRHRAAARARPTRAGAWRRRCRARAPPPYGFGLYRAANYDELIDHPVETGDFALTTFEAGGVPHDIAISGRQTADLPRLARDLQRVCQWQIDLFGGAPFDRYLFQVTAVGDGHGGLEHRTSTSLLCRRDELPHAGMDGIDDDYLNFLGLASHEYFHAWNVKRIKPAAFMPYDLARENYTRQLWAFEGITSYYDDLALARCGLISAERYCELLARTITSVMRGPGPADAERGGLELRCLDQVLSPRREHAERGGQLLRQGRARRMRARPDAAPRRPQHARPPDALALGTLWAARHRRSGGRHPRARERARRPRPVRLLRPLRRRHRRPAAARIAGGLRA